MHTHHIQCSVPTLDFAFTASRSIVFFVLLTVALAASSQAQTTTIPLGSYNAVLAQDVRVGNLTFLGGEYQLTLLEGGKYRLGRDDFISLTGTYSVTGNLVEFASPATMDTCSGKGIYQWALSGNRLTLTAATSRVDSCLERIVSLISSPFFKQDAANSMWKNIGPTGGAVYAVLVNDGKVFAGGRRWRRISLGGQRAKLEDNAWHPR